MYSKTTRQWVSSPNHQTAGGSPEFTANQSRQQFGEYQAHLRVEGSPIIPVHPMDRVRAWIGRMAHLGNLMHQNSAN